jgi:hypothetical protein
MASEESVVFSSNTIFVIQKISQINEQFIYQIDDGTCLRYISLNANIEYIGVIYNDKFHIFKLTEGEISEEFQSHFSHIDETSINILAGKQKAHNWLSLKKKLFLTLNRIPNFLLIEAFDFKCVVFRDLDTAKQIITDLNADLQHTCPGFILNIDYIFRLRDQSLITTFSMPFNANALLLCLFNENNCVSSLEIDIGSLSKKFLTIFSRTDELYQERKFNKLLRAVVIILAKAIAPEMQYVVSNAQTAASAYLMIHSFNAIYKDRANKIILDKNSTYNEVLSGMEASDTRIIISEVELNDENIQNAISVFNETLGRVNCGPLIAAATAKGHKTRRHHKNHKQ